MDNSTAFCPQCKQDTTFMTDHQAKTCSACGYRFQTEEATLSVSPIRRRSGWLLFWVFLAAPATITFLLMAMKGEELAVISTIYGSGASALYCGVWCAARISRDWVARLLLGLVLVALFYCVSFALCFAGCAAAGNAKNLFR